MDEMKRYRCKNNHVVGFISQEGHGVNRLLYLRDSIDESAEKPAEPRVAAIINSGDVTCSICNESLVWVPSAPLLEELIASTQTLRRRFRRVEAAMNNVGYLEA